MQPFNDVVRLAAVAVAAALLAGCLPPARHAAVLPPALPAQWQAADESSADALPEAAADAAGTQRWWQAFGDAQLDALIDEALSVNADLAVAAIRVYRAKLEAGLIDAETGPQAAVNAGMNATHAFDAQRVRPLAGANGTVSYEIDLWGKLAARRDEAAWRAQASEADREAASLVLIGTTAKLYWHIGNLSGLIALSEIGIADAKQAVTMAEARLAAGAASPVDVAQARQQLAQLRAEQTQWWRGRESKRNALALLLGRPPELRGTEPANLSTAIVPEVRALVPAAVLARRPDLRAAEMRLRARLAQVDAARASLYPSFTLTGELGTSSDMLVRALQNPVASVGVALALPFIQWNTVRLNVALSESDFAQASIEFRQALYRALADVEDTLAAKTQLEAEATQRERSLNEAARATVLARTRFVLGATDAAPWLDAQRIERAAYRERVANRLAQLENRMDLFLALGGGGHKTIDG